MSSHLIDVWTFLCSLRRVLAAADGGKFILLPSKKAEVVSQCAFVSHWDHFASSSIPTRVRLVLFSCPCRDWFQSRGEGNLANGLIVYWHSYSISKHQPVTSIQSVEGLWTEKPNSCCWEMVRQTRESDWLLSNPKLMQCCPHPNHHIGALDVIDRYTAFFIIDKITMKRSQSKRGSCVPHKWAVPKVKCR